MYKFKYNILIAAIIFNFSNLIAQNNKIPPEKPKLVIAIIVDQMRYDYIFKYWNKFDNIGFKRLISEGTFYKNANQNYLFTQTGPGHATIFTGTTPSNHGIISNEWYLRSKGEKVNCTGDAKVKTVGSNSEYGKMSPALLLTNTIGDELKLSNNKKSKVIGIAIKDRGAILPAGHLANAAYWYDNKTGNWITSSYYMDTLPSWVNQFNNKKLADFYLDRTWTTILPIKDYTESLPDSNKYEKGFENKQITFPYNLVELSKKNKNEKDYSILRYTPFGNTLTEDFAINTIINEGLGKDEYTDFLSISFSSTDYIGHLFGNTSVEIEDTYLRLDKEIAHFLQFIDDYFKKENVLIFLTADHGCSYPPEYLIDSKTPSGIFKQYYYVALLKSYMNALYGEGDWIKYYGEQQVYLNHNLIEDSKLSLADVQTKVSQFLIQVTGISNVLTSTTLENTYFSDGIFQKMQNSFNQKRSGDILINLEPGWTLDNESSADHNTSYSYDTHVPLIWYGWKISRKSILKPVNLIDIAPTISMFLNIDFPDGNTGTPLYDILE